MRVISAVRDLWSALCAAASKLGHLLYLENIPPFATSLLYGPLLLLCGPYLLSPYSFSFMVVPTFLVAYLMPFYQQFLISSFKRIISIFRTLIQI